MQLQVFQASNFTDTMPALSLDLFYDVQGAIGSNGIVEDGFGHLVFVVVASAVSTLSQNTNESRTKAHASDPNCVLLSSSFLLSLTPEDFEMVLRLSSKNI